MNLNETEFEAWRSNGAFTEEIQNRIRNLLSHTKREVELLNIEISTMKSVGPLPSNELSTLLGKKMEEMENLRGAISPLKKIPRELLCAFFLYCADSEIPVEIPPRRSQAFPWTLAQVCSHWRNVLWGTPGVWEKVKLRDDLLECEIPAITSIFWEILRHSATLISLVVPHNNELFSDLVIPCLNHLKALEATICKDSFHTLLKLPAGSVNSLKSINLHFIGDDLPSLENNRFQTAQDLRKVTLTMNHLSTRERPDCLWLLPWAHLTDIAFPNSIIPIHTILEYMQSWNNVCDCVPAPWLLDVVYPQIFLANKL